MKAVDEPYEWGLQVPVDVETVSNTGVSLNYTH